MDRVVYLNYYRHLMMIPFIDSGHFSLYVCLSFGRFCPIRISYPLAIFFCFRLIWCSDTSGQFNSINNSEFFFCSVKQINRRKKKLLSSNRVQIQFFFLLPNFSSIHFVVIIIIILLLLLWLWRKKNMQ